MKKRTTLFEGEATGHSHRLQNTEVFEQSSTHVTFNIVTDDEFVSHEEHKSMPLTRGKWAAGQVNEYNHFEEELRPVVD